MTIAYAEAAADTATATTPNWSVGIPIILIFFVIPTVLIIWRKKSKKKKSKASADAYQKGREEALNKLKSMGVDLSNGIRYETLAYYVDKASRKIAFAWYQVPPIVKVINFDDIISCEIIFDGTRKTTNTYVGTNNNGVRVGNVTSSNTDYVNQLGLKIMVRDPVNPTVTIPLITKRMLAFKPEVQGNQDFARKVKDSIDVIINS